MSQKSLIFGVIAAMLMTAVAYPVAAHHSYAPYDMTTTVSAQATLKDFHWGAPHSSASFNIKGTGGKEQLLTLQGAAPALMARAGFSPKDMRRGLKVEITWHPLRNGTPGGTLALIKFPDGRVFKDSEYDFDEPAPAQPGTQPPAQP